MTKFNDGKINEKTFRVFGGWPSFKSQSWAVRVTKLILRQPEIVDLSVIPEGWFLSKLTHRHSEEPRVPLNLENDGMNPWRCDLVRADTGAFRSGFGKTPMYAIGMAVKAANRADYFNPKTEEKP